MSAWVAIAFALGAAAGYFALLFRGRADPHHEFMLEMLHRLDERGESSESDTVHNNC